MFSNFCFSFKLSFSSKILIFFFTYPLLIKQIVKETIGVDVNEKAALSLKKLPFRLHQFRFFLGEQSRVFLANNYGDSIFALLISLAHHLCYG